MNTMVQFDIRTSMGIQKHKTPLRNRVLLFITKSADAGAIWIFIGLCMLGIPHLRSSGILFLEVLIITAVVNNLVIKSLVMRKRPCDIFKHVPLLIKRPCGSSFPSGHTAVAFACAVTLCVICLPVGILALIWAALIGFTRVYFFVHFLTDVLCGAISGIILSTLSIWLLSML